MRPRARGTTGRGGVSGCPSRRCRRTKIAQVRRQSPRRARRRRRPPRRRRPRSTAERRGASPSTRGAHLARRQRGRERRPRRTPPEHDVRHRGVSIAGIRRTGEAQTQSAPPPRRTPSRSTVRSVVMRTSKSSCAAARNIRSRADNAWRRQGALYQTKCAPVLYETYGTRGLIHLHT